MKTPLDFNIVYFKETIDCCSSFIIMQCKTNIIILRSSDRYNCLDNFDGTLIKVPFISIHIALDKSKLDIAIL